MNNVEEKNLKLIKLFQIFFFDIIHKLILISQVSVHQYDHSQDNDHVCVEVIMQIHWYICF